MPSPKSSKFNVSYLLFSVCIAAFLTYFVLSLPEGISAALRDSVVSVRGGGSYLAYAYGTTVPTTTANNPTFPDFPGYDPPFIDFPDVKIDLCPGVSKNVYLAYANGTAKPQNVSAQITNLERDSQAYTLVVKNFNVSATAKDIYVYVVNTSDANVPVSVIGMGGFEDPIPSLPPNESRNITMGVILTGFLYDSYNVSHAIRVCGRTETYNELTPVYTYGAPSPGRIIGVRSTVRGGGNKGGKDIRPPTCNSANYDISITPASWNITISNVSDPNVICSAIKQKFTITSNGSKEIQELHVAAWNNLSSITHFDPVIQGIPLASGASQSFIAFVFTTESTNSNGTYINVSFNCQGNARGTKQIPILYTKPAGTWDGDWPVAMPVYMRPTWKGSPGASYYKAQVASGAVIRTDSTVQHYAQSIRSVICVNCPYSRFPFDIPTGISNTDVITNAKLVMSYPGQNCGEQAGSASVQVWFGTSNSDGKCAVDSMSHLIYTHVGPNPKNQVITADLESSWIGTSILGQASGACGRSSHGWTCDKTGWSNVQTPMKDFDNMALLYATQSSTGHWCMTPTYTLEFDYGTGTTTTSTSTTTLFTPTINLDYPTASDAQTLTANTFIDFNYTLNVSSNPSGSSQSWRSAHLWHNSSGTWARRVSTGSPANGSGSFRYDFIRYWPTYEGNLIWGMYGVSGHGTTVGSGSNITFAVHSTTTTTTSTSSTLNPGWDSCTGDQICEYQAGGGAPRRAQIYRQDLGRWLSGVTCADANCPTATTLGAGGSDFGSDQVCDRTGNDVQDGCCCLTTTSTTTIAPVVTLSYPTAAATVTNSAGTMTFNFTATDNEGINRVYIYNNYSGNWGIAVTDTTGTSGAYSKAFTVAKTYNGDLFWNVLAYDIKVSSSWATANLTFTLASTTTTTTTTTTTLFKDSAPCVLCTTDYTNESLAQSGNMSYACSDEIDNDCDALTDCEDIDCCAQDNSSGCIGASIYCPIPEDWSPATTCDNDIDDDGDSLIDCADVDDCCDEAVCSSSVFCASYSFFAGYPLTYTMFDNESNIVLAGNLLPNHFVGLDPETSNGNKQKIKGRVRLRKLDGVYQIAIVNKTSASGIIAYWVHNFNTANVNLSKRVWIERGRSWVAGQGWADLSPGANATFFVPNWDGNCSDVYECPTSFYGCQTGGSLVPASRINGTLDTAFCIVSNVTSGAVENRNGSNLFGGNNTEPVLSQPVVSPTEGTPDTTFNFSVNYSDADNNAPFMMKVRIGDREYDMTAAVSGDSNYTDGRIYFWTKQLKSRSFNVTFFAVDGTSFYDGATAVLGHDPSSGTIDSDFKFTVYPVTNMTTNWNMVSSPVSLTTATLAGLGIDSSCDTLVYWDPVSGAFVDASTVDTVKSYWIYCSAATQATFTGTETQMNNITFTAPTDCTGGRCYQPVAWSSLNTARVSDVFLNDCTESGGGTAAQLVMWDPATQAFQTADSNSQEFANMIPGYGFYILKPPTVDPAAFCGTTAGGGWDYQTWKSYPGEESKCFDQNSRSFIECWDD